MSSACRECMQYQKRHHDLQNRRLNLWRRGELTASAEEGLNEEEQRLFEASRLHEASTHGREPEHNEPSTPERRTG